MELRGVERVVLGLHRRNELLTDGGGGLTNEVPEAGQWLACVEILRVDCVVMAEVEHSLSGAHRLEVLALPVREDLAVVLQDLEGVDLRCLIVDALYGLAVEVSGEVAQKLVAQACAPYRKRPSFFILLLSIL